MDIFKQLVDDVAQKRREMIEDGLEQMITDPEGRGLLILESQYGVIISAELSKDVPTGMLILKQRWVD